MGPLAPDLKSAPDASPQVRPGALWVGQGLQALSSWRLGLNPQVIPQTLKTPSACFLPVPGLDGEGTTVEEATWIY